MTTVNLVYLVTPVRGGWPTYTAHLAHGLRAAGHEVNLWKRGRRTEDKQRSFGRGLTYRNASAEMLSHLARTGDPMHIVAAEFQQADVVKDLVGQGAGITIHDPTELKGYMPDALREAKRPVIAARAPVLKMLVMKLGVSSRLVYHPYQRMPQPDRSRIDFNAVAFSRLDWDKGTHHLVKFNRGAAQHRAVHLWGAENRLYTHHKLNEIDPNWRRFYHGAWPVDDLWGGARLAQRSRMAVDMSSIKGDGGGTQYTFLEALDAGATLILNKAWLVEGHAVDEMWDYAHFADPELDLEKMLLNEPDAKDPTGLFEDHDAKTRAVQTVGL